MNSVMNSVDKLKRAQHSLDTDASLLRLLN
jgi:hypothetical protein